MRFGLFAHSEGVECASLEGGCVGHRIGDRIGAEGEPADGLGVPPVVVEELEPDASKEHLSLAGHRGQASVDVVRRALPTGQDEIAETDGALEQQRVQLIALSQELACCHVSDSSLGKALFNRASASRSGSRSIMGGVALAGHSTNSVNKPCAGGRENSQARPPSVEVAATTSFQSWK
jgi:hypothetical protein